MTKHLRTFLTALCSTLVALILIAPGLKAQGVNNYTQTNLVTGNKSYATAPVFDPKLINPWGLADGPGTPLWVANQGTSTSTLYSINNLQADSPFFVSIPKAPAKMQGPTGIVYNPAQAIGAFPISAPDGTVPAFYIYDNLNGTISGWSKNSSGGLKSAVIAVDTPGAMYKGLAMGRMGKAWTLYAADATPMGGIKVFNSRFKELQLGAMAFQDPSLPALPGAAQVVWTTFNVENIGGNIFVTYAPIPVTGGHPVFTSNAGVVAEFTPEGRFLRNIIVEGWHASTNGLDDPWALVMAPKTFGLFKNDLLVGNFGSGEILAYKPTATGMYSFKGALESKGKPIQDGKLWDLTFGNGADGASPNTLYLATGGANPMMDGLFADITPANP